MCPCSSIHSPDNPAMIYSQDQRNNNQAKQGLGCKLAYPKARIQGDGEETNHLNPNFIFYSWVSLVVEKTQTKKQHQMTRQYLTHSQDPGGNKARLAMPTARVLSQTYQPVIENYLYFLKKYFYMMLFLLPAQRSTDLNLHNSGVVCIFLCLINSIKYLWRSRVFRPSNAGHFYDFSLTLL